MKDKNGQFQLLHNCSFEQDIYDTSMEHDGISTKRTLQAYCKRFCMGREDCWVYIEGVLCNYALRLIPIEKNYNLYLYQYIRGESV